MPPPYALAPLEVLAAEMALEVDVVDDAVHELSMLLEMAKLLPLIKVLPL